MFEVGDAVTILKGKHVGTSSYVIDVVIRTNNRKYDTTTGRYGVPYYAYKLSNIPGTIKEEHLEKFLIDPEEVDEAVQSLHALLADLQESVGD